MKLLLLFTLILTTQANNLRNQDATLFRFPTQEAAVQRDVELPDECSICQNIVAEMQNEVAADGSLYQQAKLEKFKTLARHLCHRYSDTDTKDENELIVLRDAEKKCISLMDDVQMMMDHLYDKNPSTCEVMDHCKRCRPCPPPAECIICEPPMASELGLMDMIHTSLKSFKEWVKKPLPDDIMMEDPFNV